MDKAMSDTEETTPETTEAPVEAPAPSAEPPAVEAPDTALITDTRVLEAIEAAKPVYEIVARQYVCKIGQEVNPDQEALDKWKRTNSEERRYEYTLDANSVCVDLGAFHCEWAMRISNMYNRPQIFAFEAIPQIFEIGKANITGGTRPKPCQCMPGCTATEMHTPDTYTNIHLQNYAIGKEDGTAVIALGPGFGAASSLHLAADEERSVTVKVRSIKSMFAELKITHVDVMKINIEGAEYDVLECMVENGLHKIVDNFQVQFHRLGENYLQRYCDIKNALNRTHKLTWEFPFIWENWERRE
jgi:FkbM family methyltransferase